MYKLILNYGFILLLLIIVSCKKDHADDIKIVEKYVIQGKILDDTINWRINNTTIQPVMVGSGRLSNFVADENIQKSVFTYSHVNRQNVIQQVSVISPSFNVNDSPDNLKMLFSPGKKEFNDERISKLSGFKIEVLYKDQLYTSSLGDQTNKTFEIKKVEFLPYEADPENFIIAKTSININCSVYDKDKNYIGEIKNLNVDADFKLEN